MSPTLISRLQQKKKLLEKGDIEHAQIKTALVIGGGGMRGIYGAGVAQALKELGLENIFDMVIAVSAGSIITSYFLSGKAEVIPSVFYKHLASRQFVNLLNFKQIVNLSYLHNVLLQKEPLNQILVKQSRSEFYIGVTNAETGRAEYINAKEKDIDIFTAICASSSIPLTQSKIVTIKNARYFDGVISCGIPVTPALEKGCTDILVVLNDPLGGIRLLSELPFKNILFQLSPFKISCEMEKAIYSIKETYSESLEKLLLSEKKGIHIGIISPEYMNITPFSKNKLKLRSIAWNAILQTKKEFEEYI